jgi:RHS repeat-associated protein
VGQVLDEETGFHYNRHRYYDPQTAAYTVPDPLGLAAGSNPHHYVPNPTTWTDPLGLAACGGAPSSAVDDVALGLRDSGDVGGVANRDWIGAGLANEGPFVQRFYQAMYRSTSNGGRIRFNLDGLDIDRALSTNRFSDPFDVGATNWELQQILANPRFRGATDFYLDGQVLSADRVASLGLGG